MKQVTIYYKNNPKDFKELFKYIIFRAPRWKLLLLFFIYILNLLLIFVTVGGILISVLYTKIPLTMVMEDFGPLVFIVILLTILTHVWFVLGYRLFCKKLWKNLQTKSIFKIKSITFREKDLSIYKIANDIEEIEEIKYSTFSKIKQKETCFFFLLKEKVYIFCPRKYFTENEWNTVNKWLNLVN